LDILSQLVDDLLIRAFEEVVGAIALVGSDEVWVQGGWERLDLLELVLELGDKSRLENMGSLASFVEVHVRDIPSGDLEVNWVGHGHDVLDWLVHILQRACLLVELEAHVSRGALGE
jgi:hypothetical protein